MAIGSNISARQRLTEVRPTEQLTTEQAVKMCRESGQGKQAVQVNRNTWIEVPVGCDNIEERVCIWRNCHENNS